MQWSTVVYGKIYNDEMLAFVDRRTAVRVWTFKEFRQNWKAYRVGENIVVTVDDELLDYTNVTTMTETEFAAYKNELLWGNDIENGGASFGYQRNPINKA